MELVYAIGPERWFQIGEAMCMNPYGFRSGWPDLMLTNDAGDLLGVEVKVSDRLRLSQIETLPTLRDEIGIPVEVWRLSPAA